MIQFNFKSEYLVACRKQREGEQMKISGICKAKDLIKEIAFRWYGSVKSGH